MLDNSKDSGEKYNCVIDHCKVHKDPTSVLSACGLLCTISHTKILLSNLMPIYIESLDPA